MTKNVKKIIGFLYCLVFCAIIAMVIPQIAMAEEEIIIDEINFPDEAFKNYVINEFDQNKNGKLSNEEITGVTELDVSYKGIENIKGIEHFTTLKKLDCSSNQLTSLDVSKNTALTSLTCSYNQLTGLDVSKNMSLTSLACSLTQLTSLDVSNNTALTSLDCSNNQLTSLDVNNNTALTSLICYSNQLISLDVSNNTALTSLTCSYNQLTGLDVSKNTALTGLDCSSNQLISLDVSNNTALISLDCSYNQLTSLDLNMSLTSLTCSNNQLTSLDVSKNTALTSLTCSSNQLTSLDVSNNTALTSLTCSANLTSLDVSNNTALTSLNCPYNQLTSLDVSKNTALTSLNCPYNQLTSLDVSKNTALTFLDCFDNQLTNLDLNMSLTTLTCFSNQLTSLDISKNTALTSLGCSNNQLTSLDVSKNTALTSLDCSHNQLTSLDASNNTALTSLTCSNNQLTSLDVSKNTALTSLDCSNNQLTNLDASKNTTLIFLDCYLNQLTELKLHSQTYDTLSLYKFKLHSSNTISDLQNVTLENNIIKVTDITKPAIYKVNGKDFTIIYTDTLVAPPPSSPSTSPSVKPSPVPSATPTQAPTPSPGPVAPFDAHIFSDYNYTSSVTDDATIIYGNGKTQIVDGKKMNNKLCTVYTDILASYKYTLNSKGIVKPSTGKVIVGITKSDTKPEVSSKNKITDTSASKIARAKIQNGQITVTAVGKEGGLVYLWVIDTGNKGVSACCPINVKLAPTKLEIQNTSGSKLTKNTKLQNSKTLDVCIAGLVGTAKTQDCTYTAEVTSKYKNYVEVVPVEGSSNKFTINAKRLKNNKDTKVTVTFKCDQNGKKANLSLTITK